MGAPPELAQLGETIPLTGPSAAVGGRRQPPARGWGECGGCNASGDARHPPSSRQDRWWTQAWNTVPSLHPAGRHASPLGSQAPGTGEGGDCGRVAYVRVPCAPSMLGRDCGRYIPYRGYWGVILPRGGSSGRCASSGKQGRPLLPRLTAPQGSRIARLSSTHLAHNVRDHGVLTKKDAPRPADGREAGRLSMSEVYARSLTSALRASLPIAGPMAYAVLVLIDPPPVMALT